MNTEKTNYIKNVLEILKLRSCENGTLENKNGKKEKLNFNGKHFVKNLDRPQKQKKNWLGNKSAFPLQFDIFYQ